MSTEHKQRWRTVLSMVTVVALAGLIYVLRDDIINTIQNLDDINFWVLPTMLVWQGLSYHSYAKLYQSVFAILGEKIRYRSMLRVCIELNFVNNVFPSGGVSGFSYFGVRMKDADVPPAQSTLVQFARFISVFVSFQILLLIGVVMLSLSGDVNNLTILVVGSIVTLVVVGTVGLAYIVGSKRRINALFTSLPRVINRVIHIFRRGSPETINIAKLRDMFGELHENYLQLKSNPGALRRPLIWALLVNVGEVMTIYTVYIAFGSFVNPGAVILAYAVANFAGLISILPSGIGIYEAIMTGTLAAAGIPAALSIPVTVTYRILNMAINLPIGYYFYYRALHRKRRA